MLIGTCLLLAPMPLPLPLPRPLPRKFDFNIVDYYSNLETKRTQQGIHSKEITQNLSTWQQVCFINRRKYTYVEIRTISYLENIFIQN